MIIICEDCGKKYNLDPSQIRGARARVRCRACGHLMVVVKPAEPVPSPPTGVEESPPPAPAEGPAPEALPDATANVPPGSGGPVSGVSAVRPQMAPLVLSGLRTSTCLVLNFIGFILTLALVLATLYLHTVPPMLREQATLRAAAITQSLAAAVHQPLLLRNYLHVNQLAEGSVQLPGVAYVAVINPRGVVVAGLFSQLDRFSGDFAVQVRNTGFPPELAGDNRLGAGEGSASRTLTVGGRQVYDVSVALADGGGEVHAALFTDDIERLARESLRPLLLLLAFMALLGVLSFMLLARGIARPIARLTEIAQRISLGEITLPIDVRGSREVNDLAASLERLRLSVRLALERLQGRRD